MEEFYLPNDAFVWVRVMILQEQIVGLSDN